MLGTSVVQVDPLNVVIHNNHAQETGGGVAVGSKHFELSDMLRVVTDNTSPFNGNIAVATTNITVVGNASMVDFVSRPGAQEGLLPVKVVVSGFYGLPCENVAVDALFGGQYLIGTSTSGEGGLAELLLRVQQPPGLYNITFSVQDDPGVPPAILSLRIRPCIRGEVAPSPDTCMVCPPSSYSLDPSQQACQQCPTLGASCPGGAAVVSEPGWWHSAADSAQMHR
jgi:hypothetical protein